MCNLLQLLWQGQLGESITAITTSTDRWAASSAAGEVVCWENNTITYYQAAQKFSIDCLAYSADGHYLAASGQAGIVQIWHAGEPWQTIPYPRTWIDRFHWHPHLPILAVAVGKLVQIWDIANQKLLVTLPFERSSVFDLAWHPAGSHLAVAGYGGVAVWQWEQWQQYELLAVETSSHRLAWSSDGSFLATATIDRQLTIAKLAELERPWIIPDLPAKIRQIQWFADTAIVAIISDGELTSWRYADENWYLDAAPDIVVSIATHPQMPILASISPAGLIALQDTDFTVLAQFDQQTTDLLDRSILQWNKIGDHLVIGNNSGQISYWSVRL
jgi:WD40 repeat protein